MSDLAGVGPRLRAARHAVGFTIDNIADMTGLSRSFVSKVERDEASPSVKTLVSLCQVLGIDVGALFAAPELRHIRRGDQPMVSRIVEGSLQEFVVSPRGLEAYHLVQALLGPGTTTGSELFALQSDTETVYVIRGTLTMMFASESVEVAAGESLTFPAREPHGWANLSTSEGAEVLWVIAPAPWASSLGRQASAWSPSA